MAISGVNTYNNVYENVYATKQKEETKETSTAQKKTDTENKGSLWICDIYFAYSELCEWLDSDGQLIAAIALGYPNEFPKERPRKNIDDIVEWRN